VLEAGWEEEPNWAVVSLTRTGPFRAGLIFFFLTGRDHVIIFHIYLSPENYTKYALFIIKKVF